MKKECLHIKNKISGFTRTLKLVSGFSIVEVLLAATIFSMLTVALVGILSLGEEASVLGGERSRAVFLSEEGLEAVRNIRDESFANLADGSYGLVKLANQWTFAGAPDVNGIFSRTVNISTINPNTKLIISIVNWRQNLQRSGNVALTTYLTNWKPF